MLTTSRMMLTSSWIMLTPSRMMLTPSRIMLTTKSQPADPRHIHSVIVVSCSVAMYYEGGGGALPGMDCIILTARRTIDANAFH